MFITKNYSKIENRYEVYFILDKLEEFSNNNIYIILLVDIFFLKNLFNISHVLILSEIFFIW